MEKRKQKLGRRHQRRRGLPPVAFAAHPISGEPIMICRRTNGYYVVSTHLAVDELNRAFGVSEAEARAILSGSMFGWDLPGADPAFYAAPVRCRPRRPRGLL